MRTRVDADSQIMALSLPGFIAVLFVPTLFWAIYHYLKDRRRTEPIRWLGFAYLLGIGCGVLAVQAYRLLDVFGLRYDAYELAATSRPALLLYAVLAIGGIEESVKLIPFLWIIVRLKHFDELIDGVVYASFIALGYATFENLLYARYVDGIELLARSITAPLVHVVFASIWGHLIALAHQRGRRLLPAALGGLALAALLHGLYDFLLIGFAAGYRLVAAALLLAIWFWRLELFRRGGSR